MVEQILHKDISIGKLIDICEVKYKAWPQHTFASHMVWMQDNLIASDIHILYYSGESLEAYLNLFDKEIDVDGVKLKVKGFGNLCAKNNGRAYGSLLMKIVMDLYKDKFLSFCNDEYVNYYKHFGWTFAHKSKLEFPEVDLDSIRVMLYGIENYNLITYKGVKF